MDNQRDTPLRVLVAAEVDVRCRLEIFLEQEAVEIVGCETDHRSIIELGRLLQPDVAVLALDRGQADALALARDIRTACRGMRLILVEGDPSSSDLLAAFGTGIRGYVLRTRLRDDLARAVRDVSRGEPFLSPCASRVLVQVHLESTRDAAPPHGAPRSREPGS